MTGGRCHGPHCGPDCVACEVYALAEQLPPVEDREPIKLTDWQIDMLHDLYSKTPDGKYSFGGQFGQYYGVPIRRVDTVEESTLYELGAAKPQVAPVPAGNNWWSRAFHWLFGRTT